MDVSAIGGVQSSITIRKNRKTPMDVDVVSRTATAPMKADASMEETSALAPLNQSWDAVVVGGGVAGASMACRLAKRGLSVLLVERKIFPRYKVCGSCLNLRAVAFLSRMGLEPALREQGARALRGINLAAGGKAAHIPLPGGMAISRAVLDKVLVDHARSAGVTFREDTVATLGAVAGDHRPVTLCRRGESRTVHARLVVAAGGLQGTLLDRSGEARVHVAPRSRLGVGTSLSIPPGTLEPGIIHMACGPRGYVGLVRIEGDGVAVAAALDRDYTRQKNSTGAAVAEIVRTSGLRVPEMLEAAEWTGTPPLTRCATRLAAERVVVIGDAAGYVEPFTGEGMAWAFESAAAADQLLDGKLDHDWVRLERAWSKVYRTRIRRRRMLCHGASRLLRSPAASRLIISMLSRRPGIAGPVVHRLNQVVRS